MQVKTLQLTDLIEDPNNVRTHPEKNMAAIKASLERFGQVEPLVIREDGTVIAGNGRLRAMRALDWSVAQIVRVDVDDEQARALGVALNRTSDLAEWDSGRLHAVLQDIPDLTELLQFDTKELKRIEFDVMVGSGEIEKDEVPELPAQAVTKLGDVWTLGKHTVVCGNNAKIVMPDPSKSIFIIDPPYGIAHPTNYRSRGRGFGSGLGYAIFSRDYPPVHGDDHPFDPSPFLDRPSCLWGANYFADRLPLSSGWLVWDKKRPDDIDQATCELAWTNFVKGVRRFEFLWNGFMRAGSDELVHPTQKPVKLIVWVLSLRWTPGGIVIDPFLGSGTTLIAAEQLGRVCYGIEIEPRYVDVTIERWQNLTGEKAVRKSG